MCVHVSEFDESLGCKFVCSFFMFMVKIENRFDEFLFDDWGKKAWKQFTITKNTSQWKAEERKGK